MRHLAVIGRVAASAAAVGAVTFVYVSVLPVNPTTVALTYLVAILLIATWWGIAEASIASLVAVACFNYFFLPPVRTWTIADPQNWVALVAFLITAVVASQLSGRARKRNIEALSRQSDLERLYAFSRALLLSEPGASLPGTIARHIATAFDLPAVGLYDQRTDVVSWAGSKELRSIDERLREVARRASSFHDPSGVVVVAIQLGGAPIGSVAMADAALSDTVLQSVANLAAIGLERARAEEATARAEAARESSELRATVLDALAHEFKTPLTSMKAASGDLLASRTVSDRDRELVSIIDEDLDQFQALVTDAVQMLRIDAGDFAVHLNRHSLAELVRNVLGKFERRLDGHPVLTRVPEGLMVDADQALVGLALRLLLDNALKYSPPSSNIEITAAANGSVDITVRNSGAAIPEREQAHLFERFYRGAGAGRIPGTGMGLAIARRVAQAHGGNLTLLSSSDLGTAFTLSIPAAGARS